MMMSRERATLFVYYRKYVFRNLRIYDKELPLLYRRSRDAV